MLSNILVALLVVQVACGEDTSNLRGRVETIDKKLDAQSPVPASSEARPKSNEAYVNKIFSDLKAKLRGDDAKGAAAKAMLDYQGGGNAQHSYDGYLVSRQRKGTNNWNECSGQVENLVARNLGCDRTGETGSTSSYCSHDGYGYVHTSMYEYGNQNCTGNIISAAYSTVNDCWYGYSVECVQHNNVPAFAEKDGLTTYTFRYPYDCYNFATAYLGYYPYGTDDYPDIDDYAPSSLPSDYYDKCCSQYSIDQGCPFPLCTGPATETPTEAPTEAPTESPTDAPIEEGDRRLGAYAAPAATAKWWETQEFKDKLAAHKVQKTAAAPKAATTTETAAKAAPGNKQVQSDMYNELSLEQQRNGICSYEEKYDLWVKSWCNGKKQQMTYMLFDDDQCTRAITKTEHNIYDMVPNYGKCEVSGNGNGRTSLTVCHNNGGPSFSPPRE